MTTSHDGDAAEIVLRRFQRPVDVGPSSYEIRVHEFAAKLEAGSEGRVQAALKERSQQLVLEVWYAGKGRAWVIERAKSELVRWHQTSPGRSRGQVKRFASCSGVDELDKDLATSVSRWMDWVEQPQVDTTTLALSERLQAVCTDLESYARELVDDSSSGCASTGLAIEDSVPRLLVNVADPPILVFEIQLREFRGDRVWVFFEDDEGHLVFHWSSKRRLEDARCSPMPELPTHKKTVVSAVQGVGDEFFASVRKFLERRS